jgi:hypothetical protein
MKQYLFATIIVFLSLNIFAQSPCPLTVNVETGNCSSNTTYEVWLNYTLTAPTTNTQLIVYANGQSLGHFPIDSTGKLYLPQFPYNGGPNDVVKVCLSSLPNCCVIKEFPVPACLTTGLVCQINLTANATDCIGDSLYHLNLEVQILSSISSASTYQVWVNGLVVGTYPITQTSINLPNTRWNGGAYDAVKVCLINHPDCCKTIEYPVPACLTNPSTTCHIGLEATVGDCIDDSTYQLTAHVNILAPSATQTYQLWHNGVVIGTYPASQTTVVIPNANWNGGLNDAIKVCLTNHPDCCKVIEFEVPDCLTQTQCEIGPLHVQHTPCLCGQFFAIINFATNQPASGQFTVSGNGNTYGTYTYGQLPIIIGPLAGNNTTQYKFIVRDSAQPNCAEDKALGIVHCPQFASFDPVLRISPNPASTYIQVDYPEAAIDANASLELTNSLGQVMLTKQINRASTTFCDISGIGEGKYQVRILWSGGSASAQFIKVK